MQNKKQKVKCENRELNLSYNLLFTIYKISFLPLMLWRILMYITFHQSPRNYILHFLLQYPKIESNNISDIHWDIYKNIINFIDNNLWFIYLDVSTSPNFTLCKRNSSLRGGSRFSVSPLASENEMMSVLIKLLKIKKLEINNYLEIITACTY